MRSSSRSRSLGADGSTPSRVGRSEKRDDSSRLKPATANLKPSTARLKPSIASARQSQLRAIKPVAGELRAQLDQALQVLELPLEPVAVTRLLDYLALLAKWNSVYNLTAIRDPHEMLVQHLFDCLAVIRPLLDQGLLAEGAVVVDVGSGGGLPGAVIAIARPAVQVHCVDTVSKKAAFIGQVRAELGLANLHAHHARIEQLTAPASVPAANLIVSRAFSSLEQFVRCSAHLLASDGVWAAMKGRLPEDELALLPDSVELMSSQSLQVPALEASRHLLLLRPRI